MNRWAIPGRPWRDAPFCMKHLRQHIALRIGFALSILILIVLQYVSYLRNNPGVGCMDCGWRFGFPIPFYEYGGFVSYEKVLWLGLFGDIAFAVVVALWSGVLIQICSGQISTTNLGHSRQAYG